ncbi:MAG: hypothetical protein WCJ55_19750 [Chloroflexales bacterium]
MAPTVRIRFQTAVTKQAVQRAAQRVLATLAATTATAAAASAPRRSGFLASTVGAIPPNGAAVPARTGTGPSPRRAGVILAPGPQAAIAYAAASYALAVELHQPFLLTAAIAALGNAAAIVDREGF